MSFLCIPLLFRASNRKFCCAHIYFFCSRTDSSSLWLRTVEALCWLRFACTWISHETVGWIKPLWIRCDYGIMDFSNVLCFRRQSNGGFRINIRINLAKSEVDIADVSGNWKMHSTFVEHQLPNAVLRVKVIVVNLDIFLSSLKAKHEERSRHSSFCARDRRPK